jgi:competence ComEA-like helix-hairpin-helix protein
MFTKKSHVSVVTVVTFVLAIFVPAAVAVPIGQDAAQQQDPNGDKDAPVFQRVCSNCHPIARVVGARRSRQQWEEVIETMINSRNAKVTDEEFDVILGYLARQHGRVNVNQALADELMEVLALSEAVANGIVSYRKEHGTFADFDALTKVPGLDKEALEKKRDAITF